MVTMNEEALLRRTISGGHDREEHSTELPVVCRECATTVPANSHEQKQLTAFELSDIGISLTHSKFKHSSLTPMEQGTAADLEEDGSARFGGSSQR